MVADATGGGNAAELNAALGGFRDLLASDGYLVTWREAAPERVAVEIAAGEGACADCLVPKPIMEAIVSKALASGRFELASLALPTESH